MKKWMVSFTIVVILILITSCNGGQATTEAPTPEATATTAPEQTEEPKDSGIEYQAVPITDVQAILWQWQLLIETDPAGQTIVSNPEKYTLILNSDGTYSATADCNMLAGGYTSDDSLITLEPGPSTLVECGPESLYDQYVQLLASVTAFGKSGDNLVLELQEAAGVMTFSSGGPVEVEPERTCDAGIDPATVTLNTQDLPYSYQPNCVLGTPYDESQPPNPVGLPDHIQVNFGVTEPALVQPGDPIIYIIPVDEYIAIWDGAGNPALGNQIEQLRVLLLEQTEPITETLPILPYEQVRGTADIQGQATYLTTQNGPGVRFVTRFVQDPAPLTRDEPQLYYVYQGLSFDGTNLVSFFYPVTTADLPASAEISQEEINQLEADQQAYLQEKSATLNSLQPAQFDPDLSVLDQLIQSLRWVTATSIGEPPPIANVRWLWAEYTQTDPASQTVVVEPYKYSVVFAPDGSLAVVADCNNANGVYTYNGPQVTLQILASTQAACPEGSLSEQFLALLPQAATYAVQGGQLVLNLQNDAGTMTFNNGGLAVVLPPPTEGLPTATVNEPINVRSGPSTDYTSYGIAPVGAQAPVIGKSEDGGWWVIQLPPGYSSDNTGWVSADYVDVVNAENVPVIPSPPLP